MMDSRTDIFKTLKTKLVIENKNIELNWCENLKNFIKFPDNHRVDKNSIFLHFGVCKIFDDIEIRLSTVKNTNSGDKFTEIGGSLNSNEEAKELYKKIEKRLGKADHYSEEHNETYAHWEDENSKIVIYPRYHHGSEWFEYKIETKNCN